MFCVIFAARLNIDYALTVELNEEEIRQKMDVSFLVNQDCINYLSELTDYD